MWAALSTKSSFPLLVPACVHTCEQDRKCGFEGCMRMPNFNFAGEKGGLYCSQHKQDGMIDIKHKRCMFPDCTKRPSFNYTGAAAPLF